MGAPPIGSGVRSRAYFARARGSRSVERGELAEGARKLRESAQLSRQAGWKRELALTCFAAVSAEVRAGDSNGAREALEEAIGLFRGYGEGPDLDEALALQRKAGADPVG